MTVNLQASGYTWKCPECEKTNYTGPAPKQVRCSACRGEFEVGKLMHRRIKAEETEGHEKGKEMLPLFLQGAKDTGSDEAGVVLSQRKEIPF